jgi:digeranylgeranylglycerophospholipid reductase
MKEINCDILVVGGGVSGSSAARSAAMNGAKTIIIEKNSDTVKPACAEAISDYLLPLLPFQLPKTQLKWNIAGLKFYADELSITRKGNFWKGSSIERSTINPWITRQAVRAGAKLSTKTELITLKFNEDLSVTRAIVKKNEKEIKIKPKVVIAADGAKSTVAKSMNLIEEKKCSFAYITSFEMSHIKIKNPHLEQIFFDDFAQKGFAYIFPKSAHRANVGVGSVLFKDDTKKFFDRFINFNSVEKQLKGGKIIMDRSGFAPVDYSLKTNVFENVIFTGDAANQNIKPFIEGIIPGIICGDVAGVCTSNFLKNEAKLIDYNKMIENKLGEVLSSSNQILELMMKIFDKKNRADYLLLLALCSNIVDITNFESLFNKSYDELREQSEKLINCKN